MPMRIKRVAYINCDSCGRQVRIDEDTLIPNNGCTEFHDMLRSELVSVYHWRAEFDPHMDENEKFTCDTCQRADQKVMRKDIQLT